MEVCRYQTWTGQRIRIPLTGRTVRAGDLEVGGNETEHCLQQNCFLGLDP